LSGLASTDPAIEPRVRRGPGNPAWRPGQSGNPKGRAPALVDIAALARKHGPKCVEVVFNLMTRAKDPKIKLAAAIALLDRGFGRPKQELDVNASSTIQLHLVAARMVSGQLLEGKIEAEVIEDTVTPDVTKRDEQANEQPTE
jgi:hypothetical protein